MIKQKVIESCPNYAITEDGKVWSFKSNKFLKQKIDKYGYACVSLRRNGKNWTVTVHRLVAEAFIPNPDNKPTVNHKDENKLNNSVTNLEWMTVNENNNYGTHYQRVSESLIGREISDSARKKISEKNKGKKITEEHKEKLRLANTGANSKRAKCVYCVETDEIFMCISDAARKYNVDKSSIVKCCKGRKKHAGKHPITGVYLTWQEIQI